MLRLSSNFAMQELSLFDFLNKLVEVRKEGLVLNTPELLVFAQGLGLSLFMGYGAGIRQYITV